MCLLTFTQDGSYWFHHGLCQVMQLDSNWPAISAIMISYLLYLVILLNRVIQVRLICSQNVANIIVKVSRISIYMKYTLFTCLSSLICFLADAFSCLLLVCCSTLL